jgi:DNA-binding transcriptional LysR family regulator
MLTLPNFERLKTFHAIYSSRSIQKAADELNVTRSAISQSLKLLEQEIGMNLFIRDSKNFQPTPEADDLYLTINPFILDLRETIQKLESGNKTPVGHLRIGAPLDFGSNTLTNIIGKFSKRFPDITYELILAVPVKQLELLCAGKLDLAFIDNGDIHSNKFPITVQNLIKEEFVLASSPALFKSYGLSKPSFEKLTSIPIVDYLPHVPVFRMWFKHHFGKDPSKLKVAYSAESVRGVLNAISSDLGIGVVPNMLLSGEFKHLKKVETSKAHFVNQIIIARQLGKRITVKEKEFIQFCRDQFKA